MPSSLKTIASQLREIKRIQVDQSRHYLQVLETQSLELQEVKTSLFLLERTVKKLSENADERLLKDDAVDVDSLLSSNPLPSESSCTSLPPAFDSPPLSYSFDATSPGYHPMIPSLSSKQMRASSAPSTSRYFQQDYCGGNGGASCSLEYDNPRSVGLFELECGEPPLPSDSNDKLTPPLNKAMSSQDEAVYQPVGIGMPSHTPSRLRNKYTLKSSDEVISLYRCYKNAKDIGKLAIALAKYTYFGPTIMAQSTFTGRGDMTGLDPIKLRLLQGNINSIFPHMDDDQLKKVWDECKDSIAGACKSLRCASRHL